MLSQADDNVYDISGNRCLGALQAAQQAQHGGVGAYGGQQEGLSSWAAAEASNGRQARASLPQVPSVLKPWPNRHHVMLAVLSSRNLAAMFGCGLQWQTGRGLPATGAVRLKPWRTRRSTLPDSSS